MLNCVDKDDATPICPHCDAQLSEVWRRVVRTVLGKCFIFFCPACRRILGLSHRKGFWMG